jgi:rod shape-determining protein MreD
MISPLSLQRWIFTGLFLLLSMFIIFARVLPLGADTSGMPPPDTIVLLGFAWVLRRPDFVPVALFAAILLVSDLLFLRPPGLATAMAVIGLEGLRARSDLMRERGFIIEWATVASVLALMLLGERILLVLLVVPQDNLGLAVVSLAVDILFYPLIAALSVWGFRVRRLAPGKHAAEARLI